MKKCIIVGAGDFAEDKISFFKEDMIIAADGGLKALEKLKIAPNVIIGDMDSYDNPEKSIYLNNTVEFIKLPKEKDDTDTLAAIKYGFDRGYKDFEIYGALGGRLDHTLANLQCLDYIKSRGGNGVIRDKKVTIMLLYNEDIILNQAEKGRISLFAFGGKAKDVTIKGLKYEVNNVTLATDFPIGVSNEFIDKEAYISVGEGKIILYKEGIWWIF